MRLHPLKQYRAHDGDHHWVPAADGKPITNAPPFPSYTSCKRHITSHYEQLVELTKPRQPVSVEVRAMTRAQIQRLIKHLEEDLKHENHSKQSNNQAPRQSGTRQLTRARVQVGKG